MHEKASSRGMAPVDLSTLLRAFGALFVLGAAASFLVESYEGVTNLARYGSLMALTIALAGGGVLAGLRMGDSRTGRVALSLALATLPAHFAIQGGLVYSTVAESSDHAPGLWEAASFGEVALIAGLGAMVLGPVVLLALRVLTPGLGKRFGVGILGLHALLLLPTRGAWEVAHLAAVGVAVACLLDARARHHSHLASTPEARWVRTLFFAAPALMLGRSLLFYDASVLIQPPMALVTSLVLTHLAHRHLENAAREVVVAGGAFAATLAAATWVGVGVERWSDGRSTHLALTTSLFFGAASAMAISEWVEDRRGIVRAGGAALWAILSLLCLWSVELSGTAALAAWLVQLLLGGALLFTHGLLRGRRWPTIVGACAPTIGVATLAMMRVDLTFAASTRALAAIGISLLIAAVVAERYGAALRLRVRSLITLLGSFDP